MPSRCSLVAKVWQRGVWLSAVYRTCHVGDIAVFGTKVLAYFIYVDRSIKIESIFRSLVIDRSKKNDRFDRKNRIFRMFLTVFPPFICRKIESLPSIFDRLSFFKQNCSKLMYCRSCRGKPIVPLAPFRQQNKLGSSFHSELKYQPRIIPNYSVKFIKFV